MEHAEFSKLIISICDGTASRQHEDALARLCIDLAKNLLQILERRGMRIRETHDDSEMDSLAADCIADLFVRDARGQLRYFLRVFTPLLNVRSDRMELLMRLRKMVMNRVHQYLTRIYGQRDPEGAKLLRNIRLLAVRHPQLKIEKNICGTLILFQSESAMEDKVTKPSWESIERTARQTWNGRMDMKQMVLSLFQNVAVPGSLICIELTELVRLIKSQRLASERSPFSLVPVSDTTPEDLIASAEPVLKEMAAIIKKSYVDRKKLTLHQGLALFAALKDWFQTLALAEDSEEHFIYVSRHWPELDQGEYQARVRTIFEYLLRQLKARIAAQSKIIF